MITAGRRCSAAISHTFIAWGELNQPVSHLPWPYGAQAHPAEALLPDQPIDQLRRRRVLGVEHADRDEAARMARGAVEHVAVVVAVGMGRWTRQARATPLASIQSRSMASVTGGGRGGRSAWPRNLAGG